MNDAPAAQPRIKVMPGGADRRVPVENQRGVYFPPDVPTEVYDTPYIRRRLADRDLIEVDAKGKPVPPPKPEALAAEQGVPG